MLNIPRATLPATPVDVHDYIDAIAVWLKEPADRPTLKWIRQHCAHLRPPYNHPARFGGGFRQRLFIVRPDDQLLRWLAGRDDALVNYAEFALDWVFESDEERDAMFRFAHLHLVRGHHRGRRQRVGLYKFWFDRLGKRHERVVDDPADADIRYDTTRGARNKLVTYREDWSRITGQPSVVHHEWRAASAHAVQAAGISSPADLVGFDHRAFWERRLKMVEVDLERVGRLLRNRNEGTRSRAPRLVANWRGRRVNRDQQWGDVLGRAVDLGGTGTAQDFIDQWRSLGLDKGLRRIACDRLLPEERGGSKPEWGSQAGNNKEGQGYGSSTGRRHRRGQRCG